MADTINIQIFGHSFENRLKDFVLTSAVFRSNLNLRCNPLVQYLGFKGATLSRLRNNLDVKKNYHGLFSGHSGSDCWNERSYFGQFIASQCRSGHFGFSGQYSLCTGCGPCHSVSCILSRGRCTLYHRWTGLLEPFAIMLLSGERH